jgi:hypothetical protein
MSQIEITYIQCDAVGCEERVLPELLEGSGWTKDDLDNDTCPACQKLAADLEANAASGEDLAAFGAAVGEEADKAVAEAERLGLEKKEEPPLPEKPGPAPLTNVTRKEFDATLEEVVKDLRKQMKKQKYRKDFIDQAEKACRAEAAPLRPKE